MVSYDAVERYLTYFVGLPSDVTYISSKSQGLEREEGSADLSRQLRPTLWTPLGHGWELGPSNQCKNDLEAGLAPQAGLVPIPSDPALIPAESAAIPGRPRMRSRSFHRIWSDPGAIPHAIPPPKLYIGH